MKSWKAFLFISLCLSQMGYGLYLQDMSDFVIEIQTLQYDLNEWVPMIYCKTKITRENILEQIKIAYDKVEQRLYEIDDIIEKATKIANEQGESIQSCVDQANDAVVALNLNRLNECQEPSAQFQDFIIELDQLDKDRKNFADFNDCNYTDNELLIACGRMVMHEIRIRLDTARQDYPVVLQSEEIVAKNCIEDNSSYLNAGIKDVSTTLQQCIKSILH